MSGFRKTSCFQRDYRAIIDLYDIDTGLAIQYAA
jgi:hypothetical protein